MSNSVYIWYGLNDEVFSTYNLYQYGLLTRDDLIGAGYALDEIEVMYLHSGVDGLPHRASICQLFERGYLRPLGIVSAPDEAEAFAAFAGVNSPDVECFRTTRIRRVITDRDLILNNSNLCVYNVTFGGLFEATIEDKYLNQLQDLSIKYANQFNSQV